jgi:hypothetical protein
VEAQAMNSPASKSSVFSALGLLAFIVPDGDDRIAVLLCCSETLLDRALLRTRLGERATTAGRTLTRPRLCGTKR